MNGRHFPLVLLLLAMLVGQMATNAHMIDHMAVATVSCDFHVHHSNDHHHDNVNVKDTSSAMARGADNAKSDCSIYHAYAGVTGITPADSNHIGIQTKSVLFKQSLRTQIITEAFIAQPIRGPPRHS